MSISYIHGWAYGKERASFYSSFLHILQLLLLFIKIQSNLISIEILQTILYFEPRLILLIIIWPRIALPKILPTLKVCAHLGNIIGLYVQLAVFIHPECKLLISGSDITNTVQDIIENGMVHWMELDLISTKRYVVFKCKKTLRVY